MDNAERAKLKAQLRQQVEEEFAKRTQEHRVKVHTINARRRHRKANKLKAAPTASGLSGDRQLMV